MYAEESIKSGSIKTLRREYVQINVLQRKEGSPVKMILFQNVISAIKNLNIINMLKGLTVVYLVQARRPIEKDSVYNLKVKNGPHEYFANGILVHNCDSTLYAWRYCKHYIKNVAKPRIPDPNSDEYMEYRLEKLEREVTKQLRGQEDIVNDGDFDIIYGKDDW